jgi:uncharacterized membrane protein YdbT with pleckstrin-like domain
MKRRCGFSGLKYETWETRRVNTPPSVALQFCQRKNVLSYVDENLMPQEAVAYRTNLHWIIYLSSIIFFGIALLLLIGALEGGGKAAAYVALVFIAIGLVLFLIRKVKANASEFAVTNKRVIIKVGIFQRHSVEVLLSKVESIGVDQGIIGKMLGYGTIIIAGTGGTKEPFSYIENPLEFRRQVLIAEDAAKA